MLNHSEFCCKKDVAVVTAGILCLSLFFSCFNGHFPGGMWVSRYQNVSILDFIEARCIQISTPSLQPISYVPFNRCCFSGCRKGDAQCYCWHQEGHQARKT